MNNTDRAAIRARLDAASKEPCATGIYDPQRDPVEWFRDNLAFGDGPCWVVWLPTHPLTVGERPRPDHAVLMAITGNGPTSEANADLIAHAPTDLAALLDENERLRKALAVAAIPLEVLAAQIAEKPYTEMTHGFQREIVSAARHLRAAFAGREGV